MGKKFKKRNQKKKEAKSGYEVTINQADFLYINNV